MNNKVKKVVFYSTRKIHPYFSDEKHLTQSNSLIEYFSKLEENNEKRDEFSIWLSDLAFLSIFKQKLEEIVPDGREDYKEIFNIIAQTKNGNPHDINSISNYLEKHQNSEGDEFWKNTSSIFIELLKQYSHNAICFKPCLFEEYGERILSGECTHLNRDLTESKRSGGNSEYDKAKVKHRLGIYHREKEEYAVAAIWPWAGSFEKEHDENWRKTAINAVKELYPCCEEIILVMHNKDFDWCQQPGEEKDRIVFKCRLWSDLAKVADTVVPTFISYIIFQHDNGLVMNPLENRENLPDNIWFAIDRYLRADKIMRDADKDCLIAKNYDSLVE